MFLHTASLMWNEHHSQCVRGKDNALLNALLKLAAILEIRNLVLQNCRSGVLLKNFFKQNEMTSEFSLSEIINRKGSVLSCLSKIKTQLTCSFT